MFTPSFSAISVAGSRKWSQLPWKDSLVLTSNMLKEWAKHVSMLAPLITDRPPNSFTPLSKKKKKKRRRKKGHMTRDTWHVTSDMWYVTWDSWQVGEVNLLSKFHRSSSSGLGVKVFWRFGTKGSLTQLINQWIMRVFVEQPRLHRVC